MIDTHCHVFQEYYDNISNVIEKIKMSGVNKIIVNGCDMKSNLEVLQLVKKYDIVYGALGFHPTEEHENIDECMDWLNSHISDDKIVAIGEIGLDYHYENYNKNVQIDLFKKQLEIASKYKKPIIVHSRDAIQDTYDILSTYKLRGSIHSFSGSLEMAREFIKLGYCLGISGVCTFKNAKNIVNVINNVDMEYLLLETDSPYLSPEPFRGRVNSPSNIPIIAKKISDIKNKELSEVIDVTTRNACDIFDF